LSYKDKFADDLNDFDYGSDDEDTVDHDDDDERGPKTLQMIAEARDIRQIVQTSGWLDAPSDGLPEVDKDHLMLDFKPRIGFLALWSVPHVQTIYRCPQRQFTLSVDKMQLTRFSTASWPSTRFQTTV
jgi:hypothetical protein